MMKKNGFTLAEVLITLSIIGVIATLTLPTLMTNINESQNKTGFKKVINTLSEAGQMNKVVAGFDYSEINSSDVSETDAEVTNSLFALIHTNVSVNTTLGNSHITDTANTAIYFQDGTSIHYTKGDTIGKVDGFNIVVDINGNKGPNRLSNCAASSSASTEANLTADCSDKKKRYIQDRFSVKLVGTKAVPNGDAAAWAMNN